MSTPDAPAADRARNAPTRWRALVAWGVVGACAATLLWNLPSQLRHARSDIEVGTTRTRDERREQVAVTVGLTDLRLFRRAAELLPRDARYVVVTGPRTGVTDPGILRWVAPYARYTLMPRRLVTDSRRAEWVLSYGADLDRLGLRYARVVPVGRGISIAKVDHSG